MTFHQAIRRAGIAAIAAAALVVAADGYAAAGVTAKARPVTAKTVNQLIAKYVAKHQAELAGPAGPAGPPGASATRLFVSVDPTNPPSATRASGVVSIDGPDQTGTVGFFTVTFDRDVSACVPLGSRTSKDGNLPGIGAVGANHQSANVIGVQTADNAGNPAATPFSLAVFC
jgi:hypothetical protein